MKTGIQQGLALLAVGALLIVLNYAYTQESNVFPVVLMSIPVFSALGLAFLLFPGQAKGKEAQKNIIVFWKGGSRLDKTVWALSFLIGLVTGVCLFFKQLI